MPLPSKLVGGLPALVPFVGPEALERKLGFTFRLRLGANESPFGASPVATEAMRHAACQAQFYGDPEGWDLRSALAEKHGVDRENVVLAAGIDELLALFCRAFGDPGDALVTTLGSYPTLEYGAMGAGLAIHRVPYKHDAIDLEGLVNEARSWNAKVVYLANPDNPSGSFHSSDKVSTFRAALPEGCLLLLDEAYSDFVLEESLPHIDVEDAGVVRLRTFSKGHGMAGMRVGYAVGHASTVGMLNRIRMHFGVSRVSLAGALASLSDPQYVSFVRQQTDLGRRRIIEMAARFGFPSLPSATNFLLIDAGSKTRADSLLNALLQQGVFVRKPNLPPLDRCVRVTIGRSEDIDALEEFFEAAVKAIR